MNPNKPSTSLNTALFLTGPQSAKTGSNARCPAQERWRVKRAAALCAKVSRTPSGPFASLMCPSYSLVQEQQRLVQCLSEQLPPAFSAFINALVQDEVIAVLLTTPLMRADGNMVMPIDDIKRQASRAGNSPSVLSHERALTQLAALIQPLGEFLLIHHSRWKAWGKAHPHRGMQEVMLHLDASNETLNALRHSQMRDSILVDLSLTLVETQLRILRRDSPQAADILCSVCTGREYEDMDAQQIHRMSAAVNRSQAALKMSWLEC